ncbi:MAG: hypothetical protein WB818_19700 [Desulfobacterales bacterium]|jgi:hypothetical protein
MNLHLVKTFLMLISLVFIFSNASFAGGRIEHRQNNQKNRTYQGVRKVEITKREFTHLSLQQRNVEKYRNPALRDGNLSREEGRRLNYLQDRAGGSIYRDRHNGYNRDRHYQHNRQRYSGPAYGYGYTPHRYYRPLSGYTFYSLWASPGWAFGFSTRGR